MGNTRARPRGLRHSTRYLFSRDFRRKGFVPLSTYMRTYKLGDYVDIKANPAQQKGMPFRHYHGRTGRVWNVSPRALGVEVNKLVGNRVLKKRIYVRLEHVQPSRCREDFEQRKRTNDRLRAEAKQRGEKPPLLKRQPEQPKSGELVTNVSAETVTPVPFDIIREGIKNK